VTQYVIQKKKDMHLIELCQLLWKIDMEHHKKYGTSLTGAFYFKETLEKENE
jgi:hypothetical protein